MGNETLYGDGLNRKPFVSFEGLNINPNPHPRLSKFNCFNSRHMLLAVMKTSVRFIHFRKTNSQKRCLTSENSL